MSNQMIPFESNTLPAFLQQGQAAGDVNTDLTTHVGVGYAILSIKGKVFTLVKGDERTVVTRPDDPEEAASALEVVILRANPNLSKVYYAKGYEDGSVAAPDCYSNDGIAPAADAPAVQCKTCAACPHNVFGSGSNGKGKACSDSRRIAVAAPGHLNEPMLLRIPPATLKPLAEYGKLLGNRGVPYYAVVTKIRFEREESTPKLNFTPMGFLTQEQYAEAVEVSKSDVVENIVGLNRGGAVVAAPAASKDEDLEKAIAPAKAAIDKASAQPAAKVEATAQPAPAKASTKPAAMVAEGAAAAKPKATAKVNLADDLDNLLAGLPDD